MPTDWAQFEPETKQTDWSEFTPEEPTPKELGPAFPLQEGEPPAEPQQDTSAAKAMAQWFQPAPPTNALQIKPLGDVNAPMPEQKPFLQEAQEPAINYQLQHPANEGVLAAVGREAANLALGAAEFPTSEAGAAAGMASAVAPTAVTGLFTLQMMKDLGNQVLSTYQNWGSMTPAQKAIALTDIAGTGVLGFLTGKATAKGLRRMGKTEPAIVAAEPILPQAAQAAKETKGAEEYASEISPTAEVYGDVRAQPVEGVRQVPVEEGGAGVQPQTQGGIPEAQAPSAPPRQPRVLLKELTPEERAAEQRALDEALGQETTKPEPLGWGTPVSTDAGGRPLDLRKQVKIGDYAIGQRYDPESQMGIIEFGRVKRVFKGGLEIERPSGETTRISGHLATYSKASELANAKEVFNKLSQREKSTPPPKETPTAPSAQTYRVIDARKTTKAQQYPESVSKRPFEVQSKTETSKFTTIPGATYATEAEARVALRDLARQKSTPQAEPTPTAIPPEEPSQLTPATQGISEATTPSEKAQVLDMLSAKHDLTRQQAKLVLEAFDTLPENANAESLQKAYLKLALPADMPREVGLGKVAGIKGAKEVLKDLREASAGVKALAVGEPATVGPTTRSTPPPAKAEEGARETAISTEPFLGKTKAEWTPEYYKSLSPENRRAARAQVISALKSEGGTTKVTQESKPPVVIKGIHELLDLREKKKAPTPTPPTPEVGPGMVGMGGAAAGELSESAGADIYGIAQRVREQRAAAGQTPALPRGEGVSALESVQHGRRLIAADPLAAEKAADAFGKTKAVSYDGLSAVRAKGEEAFMAARNIEQKFGTDSPEYRNAFEAASRWDKVSKEMQTVWHRTGQAQQGQTDIDTGTFTGLHRAFRAATGKDFTPQQAKQAKEKVAVVQTATAEAEAATKKLFDAIDKVLPQGKAPVDATDARKQLSSFKPGAKPNLDQIRSIWSYVKSVYISRGEANLDNIAQKASDDLGIPKLDIIKAMASPKGARALTDEAFLKLQRQRQAISAAKNWLTTANLPGWERFVRKIPRFFFMAKVFGHGTVGMVTHAGSMAFDPAAMKSYWPIFLKQYGLVFSERYHARLMQELMDDPYFATARRAGLANDPFRYQDDYQNPKLAGWFGRWGLAGNRGFDSLKLLRQARWNQIWDSFPDELKTKEMAKLLADQVNHATGIVRSDVLGRFAEPAGTILFAPKLEMSRWAFAVGDPAKATRIFLSWEKATPEERMFAISEVKQKARIFGVYMGLLALNESILQASGSDQRVNFNNPNRGDFLAFKVAGQNVSVISPMLHMGALLADMIKIGFFKRKGVEKVTPRRSAAAAAIGRYAQGKLSPFAQPIADVWFQSTFENRPMPFSADRAAKWMRQRGMGRWTWPEYLSETFTPIPVSEAIREVWRSQGMNEDEMDQAAKVLAVLTITGGTGVRLSQDIHRGGK